MAETVTVAGMVLSAMPIGEYDKRLVILTAAFGKITAFARGARKPNSKFLAGSQPMSFGEFTLYRGRNAYSVNEIKITDYFSDTLVDLERMYLGMYFLELSDYYGREGIEGTDALKLLYLAMKALKKNTLSPMLVRCIFEMRTLAINGDYPNVFQCGNCKSQENIDYYDINREVLLCKNCHEKSKPERLLSDSAVYALQYIVTAPVEKLFHFNVTDAVLLQMKRVIHSYMERHLDKKFNSLEFLEISY